MQLIICESFFLVSIHFETVQHSHLAKLAKLYNVYIYVLYVFCLIRHYKWIITGFLDCNELFINVI